MDNFSRRVWRTLYADGVDVEEENDDARHKRCQVVTAIGVGIVALLLVALEVLYTVVALPESNAVVWPHRELIGFFAKRHGGRGRLQLPTTECISGPLFDVPNFNSETSYMWCHWASRSGHQTRRRSVSQERGKEVAVWLQFGWFQGAGRRIPTAVHMRAYEELRIDGRRRTPFSFVSIRLFLVGSKAQKTYRVSFGDSLHNLTDCFLRNARLTAATTGLTVRLVNVTQASGSKRARANLVVRTTAPQSDSTHTRTVFEWLLFVLGGTLEVRAGGSRLFEYQGSSPSIRELLAPLQVGTDVTTYLSPRAAIVAAVVVVAVNFLCRLGFRDPPGLEWELLFAHGRQPADEAGDGWRQGSGLSRSDTAESGEQERSDIYTYLS